MFGAACVLFVAATGHLSDRGPAVNLPEARQRGAAVGRRVGVLVDPALFVTLAGRLRLTFFVTLSNIDVVWHLSFYVASIV